MVQGQPVTFTFNLAFLQLSRPTPPFTFALNFALDSPFLCLFHQVLDEMNHQPHTPQTRENSSNREPCSLRLKQEPEQPICNQKRHQMAKEFCPIVVAIGNPFSDFGV